MTHQQFKWPKYMYNISWRIMHVINNISMVTLLVVLHVWCRPNISTLKSVLLMYSKTSAGVLDCKERTTQGLTEEDSRLVGIIIAAWTHTLKSVTGLPQLAC